MNFQSCDGLDGIEKHYIEIYTGPIYRTINEFLLNIDTLDTYQSIQASEFTNYFYHIITDSNETNYVNISRNETKRVKTLVQSRCNNIEWFQKILFKYMLSLYGAILKCPRHHRETEVYRGVKIHYLKEDTTHGYYLNTFTSTSTNDEIADGFSNRNNGDGVIYHFIITEGVECIHIGDVEEELLINPYQSYYFIRKDGEHYYYIIRPSDIVPPHDFDEFVEFKNEIATRSVEMDGGKIEDEPYYYLKVQKTRRSKRNNRNTKKNKNIQKEKERIAREHFKARMNLPIGTSPYGFPLSNKIIADNKRIEEKFFPRNRYT